ncbi:hypothetical protein GCM10026986_23260 [Nitrincola alkalisediminis]
MCSSVVGAFTEETLDDSEEFLVDIADETSFVSTREDTESGRDWDAEGAIAAAFMLSIDITHLAV